jgi:hypothetical protein
MNQGVEEGAMTVPSGSVALIGSGELSDAMAETHRTLMARLPGPCRPVFVDTPAGFESNIDAIDRKAEDYFRRNFGLDLAVARYRTCRDSAAEVGAALSAIAQANYILAGPGSPSYAMRVLRQSPVWQTMIARLQAGALLVFASAAAVTVGTWALPVYEIFKAGFDPEWLPGLGVLGTRGPRLAVVPHWNNASGEYDTRYCYMGAARFEILERQLPADCLVLGLDEYAGVFIAPDLSADVLGSGRVTLRRAGHQALYKPGDQFSLDRPMMGGELVPVRREDGAESMAVPEESDGAGDADILALRRRVEQAMSRQDMRQAVEGLIALSLVAGAGLEQSLPGRTELAVQSLQRTLPGLLRLLEEVENAGKVREEARHLVEILVAIRASFRQSGQWTAADHLRQDLENLGYSLADTPERTSWSRRETPVG